MKYRIIILTVVMLVTGMSLLNAASSDYGFKMLNITVGVGMSGQGGTGTYSSRDASSFLENPSAPVMRQERLISLAENSWFADTRQSSLFYSYGRGNSHFGLGLRTLDYGSIEKRDETSQLVGTYHPLDLNLVASYGRRILPSLYAGINAGLVYEKIDASSSYGGVMDAGLTYLPPIQDMKVYTVVRNLGSTSKMDQEAIDLPKRFDWGISQDFTVHNIPMNLEFKSVHEIGTDWKGIVGYQATFLNNYFVRIGDRIHYDAETFSLGAGCMIRNFQIDYAYTSFNFIDNEMDSVHRVGLTYKF